MLAVDWGDKSRIRGCDDRRKYETRSPRVLRGIRRTDPEGARARPSLRQQAVREPSALGSRKPPRKHPPRTRPLERPLDSRGEMLEGGVRGRSEERVAVLED